MMLFHLLLKFFGLLDKREVFMILEELTLISTGSACVKPNSIICLVEILRNLGAFFKNVVFDAADQCIPKIILKSQRRNGFLIRPFI